METLREEVNAKLRHILHDIKNLQKTIINLRQGEKKAGKERVSKWLLLGKEISGKWEEATAVDEIREQREKRWRGKGKGERGRP
jgi:cell fate (sporulation/competence/biofilm development) regulator YmcA (YheA/YmcA/DUF963 family)